MDPVTLSVMSAALVGIAEEMGTALVRSASSSNIKERRDCSAALFDATGRMVAQAEHIPVHLGAMPESVAAVIGQNPAPGDVFVLNDPFAGGSHLPDITLVLPLDLDGDWLDLPVHGPGTAATGPAIVELPGSTCLVRPGWAGAPDDAGTLVLERTWTR